MGWKSTIDITRQTAIDLILAMADRSIYENMTNEELADIVDGLGYGDNIDLPYYGHNFLVIDKEENNEDNE